MGLFGSKTIYFVDSENVNEKWIEELTGVTNYNWASGGSACDMCPFEKYINRLAEYEDEEELMEDDRK